MKARVDNVRIKDLMAVLANLHLDYEVVDIIVYPEEKRVVINPIGDSPSIETDQRELKQTELEDRDLDII